MKQYMLALIILSCIVHIVPAQGQMRYVGLASECEEGWGLPVKSGIRKAVNFFSNSLFDDIIVMTTWTWRCFCQEVKTSSWDWMYEMMIAETWIACITAGGYRQARDACNHPHNSFLPCDWILDMRGCGSSRSLGKSLA